MNPYRSIIPEMIRDSPIVHNCAMTMSASHLSQLGQNGPAPLTFQTEAISHIAKGVAEIESGSRIRDDLLLGIILLGMTTVRIKTPYCCTTNQVRRVGMTLLL